jgi:hypothetical protein
MGDTIASPSPSSPPLKGGERLQGPLHIQFGAPREKRLE